MRDSGSERRLKSTAAETNAAVVKCLHADQTQKQQLVRSFTSKDDLKVLSS